MAVQEWSGDLRHDGISCSLGTEAELAGNGSGLSDQLGSGLSFGGVVRGVGSGTSPTRRRHIDRRGRDSLGTRNEGDNFLTVVYQIDAGCRRLLWIGKRRSEKTLRQGLKALGPDVVKGLRFVCSDMWKPYLNVLAAEEG